MALIACRRCEAYYVADAADERGIPTCPRCHTATRMAAAEEIRQAIGAREERFGGGKRHSSRADRTRRAPP